MASGLLKTVSIFLSGGLFCPQFDIMTAPLGLIMILVKIQLGPNSSMWWWFLFQLVLQLCKIKYENVKLHLILQAQKVLGIHNSKTESIHGDRAGLSCKTHVARDCLQDHFYERKPKIRFHQPIMVRLSRARQDGRRTIKTIYIKLIVVKCSIVNFIPHERVIKSIYFTGSRKIISGYFSQFQEVFIYNPL